MGFVQKVSLLIIMMTIMMKMNVKVGDVDTRFMLRGKDMSEAIRQFRCWFTSWILTTDDYAACNHHLLSIYLVDWMFPAKIMTLLCVNLTH